MSVSYGYSLKGRNTFGMDVGCSCFAEYGSVEELAYILGNSSLPRPFFHIGGGSNLLFTKDFQGTILHGCIDFIKPLGNGMVKVGAGVRWDDFCKWCAEGSLWGAENLSMIPGEVGAAAVQNIGAYGVEVCEIISSVECYDTRRSEMVTIGRDDCQYAYRDSAFKHRELFKENMIVTSVTFILDESPSPRLGYGALSEAVHERGCNDVQGIRSAVCSVRSARLPSPEEMGSAGSFYRNPQLSPEEYSAFRKKAAGLGEIPGFDLPGGGRKIPAAWLIEKCGWKGFSRGNVGVYRHQPLVIVNLNGKASPQEVISLSDDIVRSVEERFGITLEREVEYV